MTSSSLTTPPPTKDKGHGSERSVPGKETKGNKHFTTILMTVLYI